MIESLLCDDNCIISGPIRPNIITPVEEYITFADSVVKALCVANWGSNGKLSYAQAAAVTDLSDKFTGNETIISFDELQYFTGLTILKNNAFTNCNNLTSIIIPNSVTTIGIGAFEGSGLLSIIIPNSVTTIEREAFWDCSLIDNIVILSYIPPILNIDVFFNDTNLTNIYVPAESVDAYKAASGWSEYASIISSIV